MIKSLVGSLNGSSMASLSFVRIFLSLVGSGTLFMISQKFLQLLTLEAPAGHSRQMVNSIGLRQRDFVSSVAPTSI